MELVFWVGNVSNEETLVELTPELATNKFLMSVFFTKLIQYLRGVKLLELVFGVDDVSSEETLVELAPELSTKSDTPHLL